ncbi:MAG TPA: lytic transglycosylase domain-containing protein [Rhizomicrobium sp.]|nr:lytic transglycosylase domain-containing protein [Rhizomicrobium sp.]
MDHDFSTTSSRLVQALRTALLATAALGVGIAAAQTTDPLPAGLVRQGNVVMMAPIPDSGDVSAGPTFSGERRTSLIHVLSAGDHDLYARAFDAADRGDWTAARGLAAEGHDPIANRLIQWRFLLDRNSGASFDEISEFLKNYPDWPNRDTLYARAERAIDPNMEPHSVIAWFADRTPASDIGKVRLGEALIAAGSTTRGKALLREGWIDGNFEPDQEYLIIQRDGAYITPDWDRERLRRLLSRNDVTAARREMSRVSPEAQRVAEARLALRTSPTSGERMLADLPDTYRDDPGVVFDSAKLLRQQMNIDEIPKLLVRSPTREMAEISPTRWWSELNLDTREALQASSYQSAYTIAAHNGLTPDDGTDYSDAEFLAGWIALRFLKDPQTALTHFKNLASAVSRPISRARAHYWEGRAFEALGDDASAWRQYKIASETPEVFYGQLALARIEAAPDLHVRDPIIDATGAREDFEHEALTRAIRILADLGQESLLRDFAVHDVDVYGDPRHIKLLAEDLVRMGFKEVAVRVAKEASYSGISLPAYSHPVISIPSYAGPGTPPETALVLGIIRQETEFDPDSVSSAGARGIIQVMPGSVRHLANVAGLPYRPNDLTADPTYDLKIGMTELASELSDWGGSYVLTIAAYNAGPTNVRRWISQFGDPRDARIDPIDWIEQIPFGETRNYVMRVLENTEVYRDRLAGRDQKLQILADLYRPDAPQSKVLSYAPPPKNSDSSVPVPQPRPADNAMTDGTVTGAQALIPASQTSPAPDMSSSAAETPAPKPRPER